MVGAAGDVWASSLGSGRFVAEIGVGVVHHESPPPPRTTSTRRWSSSTGASSTSSTRAAASTRASTCSRSADGAGRARSSTVRSATSSTPRALAEHVAGRLDLPNPTLMRVGMNALFRAGDVVIRVGRPSAPAGLALELAARARAVTGSTVPSPATVDVFVDGELGGHLLAAAGRAATSRPTGDGWGRSCGRVHALQPDDLPAGTRSRSRPRSRGGTSTHCSQRSDREIDAAARGGLRADDRAQPGVDRDRARRVGRLPRRCASRQRGHDRWRSGRARLGPDVHGARRVGPRDVAHTRRAVGRRSGGLSGLRRRATASRSPTM